MLRISRIQYGPLLCPYGIVTEDDVLNFAFYRTSGTVRTANHLAVSTSLTDYPKIQSWFSDTEDPPVTSVSASHLRHLTIHEVRKLGADYFFPKLNFLLPALERLAKADMHESMFIGILVWALLLPDSDFELIKSSGVWQWDFTDVADFSRRIKKDFSLRLKALQNIVSLPLHRFFELEVLVNRGIGQVDWAGEKHNRTVPNTCTIPPERIFPRARAIFKKIQARGGKHKKLTWKKYWARRWMWAPTGAYHSQYAEDDAFKAKDRMLKTKLFSLLAMPEYDFSHFSSRAPCLCAWASVKYEWGKQRAIYGVDVTNFTMTGFAMPNIEEVMSEYFPIGSSANEKAVKTQVGEVLKNGVPYCFDFEDFNSQHTLKGMQAVLLAYKEVFKNMMSEEQIKAMDWVIQSVNTQMVKSEDGQWYQATATLLSGWRLTTAINTMLNKIYTEECTQDFDLVSAHNGDDILAGITSLQQVQQLERRAKSHNIRFQRNKCYLGAIAEFLRVDHKSGGGSQYLARGVSTFVHGPTEATLPNNLGGVVKSLVTRAEELLARGGRTEVISDLLEYQYANVARLWRVTVEDLQALIGSHESLGGLNETISEKSLNQRILLVEEKREERKEILEDEKRILPGVFSYARDVCNTVVLPQYEHHIATAARRSVFARSLTRRFKISVEKTVFDATLLTRASTYKMSRSEAFTAKAVLAKSFGVPIVAIDLPDDWLVRRLREEKDPLAALTHLI
ncbi:putative RNA-dependent RNA polymerase [Cronartium ribicola totivirus 3]|uniref:RNA-directed RNA polymerase n=1 Tax=Cronartium ribicola totivirus 3 TaxID=2687249 RepID=A0A6B9ELT4_9VIRU|nr:putative RNA-dependent RNA polymerase [Cronartium ribicola totivirus 3]